MGVLYVYIMAYIYHVRYVEILLTMGGTEKGTEIYICLFLDKTRHISLYIGVLYVYIMSYFYHVRYAEILLTMGGTEKGANIDPLYVSFSK